MENKDAAQTPKELKIDSNQINVSIHRNDGFYVHLCKKTLEKYDDLVLHALGNATSVSVIAAEKLVRNGYADYVSMETKTIEVEEGRKRNKDSSHPPRMVKRAKLLVTLKRSANFSENMKKYNEIKEENDQYIAAEKTAREAAK
uniref:DNA/RNA-binding protein Alba-like domain-containing protein n=1 Tax=Strombidium inclinatum TaxID=197538 RepID=A0A7S3IC33_9SPIT|mmetsp:Transcript_10252/g.15602  ORF Transcript_10252/g.15602 Transcript_10252/m.15602 type:complete len:144 (+) Transcript_10252:25-456(+)|eukprot:CAMPEP_0170493362 /NCGR_PEP_ID=MMETSP0208-20121228/13775_1 /TAXON_ID=197538 /ORGANISM="Strombidium inclinatum, Strain S3" /LENGTH=143 /DNA_ID=CAMNT_0010769283 /DNA_START=25 /DNA_END=456 /DNA_ORIENTATION=+